MTGHTIVTLKREDKPFMEEGRLDGTLAVVDSMIHNASGKYDANGEYHVDLDSLIQKLGNSGMFGLNVAVKAKDMNVPESPVPQLCVTSKKDNRLSIYIPKNMNTQRAGMAGLQFIDQLDKAVNG